uniref:Uncharacterized protein n=1 Tax=Ciona intestinalis TaxID=7719 RepID=F6RIH8_CIOIN
MDDNMREEAIDLKIRLMREKNKKLEQRRKLIEEDERQAEAASAQAKRQQHYAPDTRTKKGGKYNAHMDQPEETQDNDRHQRRPPRRDQRQQPDQRRQYDRGDHNPPHERRRNEGRNYHPEEPRDGDRGFVEERRHGRGEYGRQNQQRPHRGGRGGGDAQGGRYSDRQGEEREMQRRRNIEQMDAQMQGEEGWDEPRGLLQDPRREGAGEYSRRPPPPNVRYNKNDQHQRHNQYRDHPPSKMNNMMEKTWKGKRKRRHLLRMSLRMRIQDLYLQIVNRRKRKNRKKKREGKMRKKR